MTLFTHNATIIPFHIQQSEGTSAFLIHTDITKSSSRVKKFSIFNKEFHSFIFHESLPGCTRAKDTEDESSDSVGNCEEEIS